MSRVSQGILILLVALCLSGKAWGWKRLLSMEVGPDGSHLLYPMSATWEKGRFYVVDTGNHRLISYDAQGKPLKAVNPGGRLVAPLDLDFGPRGRLWVVERSENALLEIDLASRSIRTHRLRYRGRELFPERLVWRQGWLYVLDRETGGVVMARLEGEKLVVKKIWVPKVRPFTGFLDFKVRDDGIWALEKTTHRIFHLSSQGKEEVWKPAVGLVYPVSLEVSGGRIYILDRYLRKIFVFTLQNPPQLLYSFMEKGWRRGQLYLPRELELTPEGLLVVDEGNGRVEVWAGGS